MLTYRLNMTYEICPAITVNEDESQEAEQESCTKNYESISPKAVLNLLNKILGKECTKKDISIFAYSREGTNIGMILASKQPISNLGKIEKMLQNFFTIHSSHMQEIHITDFQEITCADFCECLVRGEQHLLLTSFNASNILSDLSMEHFDTGSRWSKLSTSYHLEEHISHAVVKTKASALRHAKEIMGHPSLKEELERIYCTKNSAKFLGHPVHYIVQAESWQTAKEIIDLLVSALHARHRLESKRIHYFSDLIPSCVKERNWKNAFSLSRHAAVVLSLADLSSEKGNVILSPREKEEDLIDALSDEMREHGADTLFILAVIGDTNRKTMSHLMEAIEGELDFVTLYEGMGERKQAKNYINHISQAYGQRVFTKEELEWALPEGKVCSATDAWNAYQKLSKQILRFEHYPAYRRQKTNDQPVPEEGEKPSSYEKLQQLVGLQEVKQLVDRILAMHRMQSLRKNLGIQAEPPSLHMVFTGHPGSAKTTVARLLAGILKELQILPTGAFVECGRGDLVGKYVGSTAPTVKRKFAEAMGGVLFIDEAYSLLDDKRGLYGDEAINTIVQEMENRRGELLVIFAGYPDPMKTFLERNEGLRSRIAFHLDFPDYDADELSDILQVMAKEKGYLLNDEILRYCRCNFLKACARPDFGNGRYVRNLLESAILCQAERLMSRPSSSKKITKQIAQSLMLSDFKESGTLLDASSEKRCIGFCRSA